jgi:hypothetical protein
MKRQLLFSLLILFSTILFSQSNKLDWVHSVDGSGSSQGTAVAIDSLGYVYTSGTFSVIADFNPDTSIAYYIEGDMWMDIYVCKYDPFGNFVWAKGFCGPGIDRPLDIAVDAFGDVIITGGFEDTTDFDPGPEVYNLVADSLSDIFIVKLDNDGFFVWARKIGGMGVDRGQSIDVDEEGLIYTTGLFSDTVVFDPIGLANPLVSMGIFDGYIAKFSSTGEIIWVNPLGGIGMDYVSDITLDNKGSLCLAGNFWDTLSIVIDTTTFMFASSGISDGFVAKLDTSGSYTWFHTFNETEYVAAYSVEIDTADNVYTTGSLKGTVDFDPGVGVYNLTAAGESDIFISKLDADGNFVWAERIGANFSDYGQYLSLDLTGNVYISGSFTYTVDFDSESPFFQYTGIPNYKYFLLKLNPNGEFVIAKRLAGSVSDMISDEYGNIYTTGGFMGTLDFDPGEGVYLLPSQSSQSAYAMRLEECSPSYGDTTIFACDNFPAPFGYYGLTNDGDYVYIQSNSLGCDSIITIHLDVEESSYDSIEVIACNGYTSPSGMYFWTDPGTYKDTIINYMGCDSIITIFLSGPSDGSMYAMECGSYTSQSGNQLWTSSGTYMDTVPNYLGCDSIITVYLTILEDTYSENNVSSCMEYDFNGETLTSSGTYYDTLTNMYSCDSVVILNLTISPLDTIVTVAGNTLTAQALVPSYIWLDCNNAFSHIPGAFFQSFTPIVSGSYAVMLIDNFCVDTSACYDITILNLEEIRSVTGITIYPNPSSERFMIEFDNLISNGKIELLNNTGQVVLEMSVIKKRNVQVDIRQFPAGTYIVRFTINDQNVLQKPIVKIK